MALLKNCAVIKSRSWDSEAA